jgi:predicted esterase
MGLSIVPPFDAEQLRARLERVSDRISAGTLATLQFQLESLEDSRRSLKSYDVAPDLRLGTARFLDDLQAAEQGRIATRTGIERRAYRSKIDGTLQPYSILVPALEPGRRYGLLVFLHGSGEDDRAGLREDLLADGFIELAPNGRGTSNAYTADHAQDDIREAIADVMTNYPIDPNRIVLAGFSMGGYGVYRTFYEDPSRYRALAVFSGHPTLGREMVGDDQPSFLEDKYLEKFRGMRIFVFHGGKDRNAPIELTQELVGKLKALGADVEFHYVPDKGHEAPPPEVKAAFRQWLLRVTAGSN